MMMKDLLTQFFDAYLVRRDLEASLAVLSENVISLGTGAHEVALNKSELRELMTHEFEAIPKGFHYEISQYCERKYREDLYGIYCTVLISMPDESGGEISFQTRFTMTAARCGNVWQAISLHMSAPSGQQEEGEFFPIKYGKRAIGKLNATAGKKLVELMLSMLPGGILGGYLEEGFPLYIINDTMLNYLGYTYEELIEETGEEIQKIIDPEDRDRVQKAIYRSAQGNGEYDIRYRVIRKDGTRLWVNDKGHIITTDDGRQAMVSVMLDINEGVRIHEKLRKEAREDPLTGILNRKGAISCIEEYMAKRQPGSIFLLDIDNFKQVNDTYGHQTGDQVLMLLADIIRRYSRSMDVAARIGGDEFLLFLPGCTRKDVLRRKADEICSDFRKAGEKYDKIKLSVSIGIAVTAGLNNFDHLFKAADDRLYAVKKSKKGGFSCPDDCAE